MPEFIFTEESTGRELSFVGDNPPDQSTVEGAFKNYDAFKVAIAGPKGSEERRRAMAQEVAAQQEATTSNESSTLGRLASAGQSFMRAGGQMVGQAASELSRVGDVLGRSGVMVGPGGAVPFSDPTLVERVVEGSKQTPLEREQQIQQDPLYQAGQSLATGAKLAYQPNPQYKGEFFADVIPSSAGAMVPTIATGLVAGPAAAGALYGLSAGQEKAEEAIASGRPETAQTASIAAVPLGALTEGILGPAANIAKLARLGLKSGVKAAAGRAALGEMFQEGGEQIGGNLIASDVAGYDPNRGAFEGVPQAMAAGALLGGVIGGASAKIAQANTTPDLLAGLSEKWKAIGLARELNTLAPVGGIGQPAPLTQGGFPQAQLDLSAQNAPPQFQMVTSEAPRTARGVSQRLAESGLREEVVAEGRTPIDQFIGRARNATLPNADDRRAALEAGLTLPQDSGKLPSDEPQPPIPPRYAQAPQLASLGTTPRTAMTTTPIDEAFMGGRLQRASLPPINPQLQQLQDLAESELNAIERFPNRDTNRRDSLLGAAPQVIQMLDTRINNSIGKVSDAKVGRLMDLRERLARFYNDQSAYNQLTAEAIGVARDTRRPAPQMAAGLSQLEQSRQSQFPAGGAAVNPEQPQSIQPQGDLMARLRDARRMDVLRQPSPMSAAQLGTGQPVGGPPAVADLTPFLQFYENQVQAPAPLPDVQGQPAQPQGEAQAPQGVAVGQGQAPRQVRSKNVNLRAKSPKPKKSPQTIIGSNEEMASVMPVSEKPTEAIPSEAPPSRPVTTIEREIEDNDARIMVIGEAMRDIKEGTVAANSRFVNQLRTEEKNRKQKIKELRGELTIARQKAAAQPISRSEPAAAQGVATEGVGVSSDEETPAFGVRRYGDALFISIAQYNRLRPLVDERLAAGDEVAKRINSIEINAEQEAAKAAGFGALTPEGQEQAVGNFKTKLYQSVAKWLAGGEFEFSSPVIAKSIAMDIGKSKAERMRKSVQSGESSEEDGVETRGAFEKVSEAVLPQEPLKAPPKVREEIILSMVNLQRQLGASKTQFGNVMMAYKDPSFAENLDDEELAMLEQARPMLGRLDNLKFSVSSLIREPIGLARAQQAVEKWKLETGATEARIQVVDDPELTTPDGRPVAAMVETRPGELPIITINAASIASEAEVREKLWHEALHPVWNEASVQKAWGDVVNSLPRGAVQAELARGYDPLEATMEAAINAASVQANNTPIRTAWQKFLDAVWEALGRVFGFDTKPKDFEQLMESALQSLSRPYNQEGEVRYSVANSFAMTRSPKEIQQRLETSSDPEALLAMGRAVASLITPEFEATLQAVENAAPGTPEATTRSFLKRADQLAKTGGAVVEWAQTHQTPIPAFQSLDDLDPQWRAVVGNAMMGAHFSLGQQMKSIDMQISNAAEKLTAAGADLMEADEGRLVAEVSRSEADRLLNNLLRTIAVERKKLGTNSQTLARKEADDAAKAIVGIRKGGLSVLGKALETMAREMPIEGFTSNEAAMDWLAKRQSKNPIFGDSAKAEQTALEKALGRLPDLTKRIEQIRALTLDNVDALREVNQLTQLIGKNKGNTVKNYAKLRADYESAFRRLKNASSRVDTWSNKMDGLLKAKEALAGLMGSQDYTGKLQQVFGDNRAVLSGLMAPMVEGGQANGVVEFYGPSAYKAAGGIVRGKELANLREGKNQTIADFGSPNYGKAPGTIYRIDWKPGFDTEKKNIENLNGLMLELSDALNNPESPNYITDPQARTSYEVVSNHVGQYLMDRRYLVEQQWEDSTVLSIMKPFNVVNGLTGILSTLMPNSYTTRMNAATALGGRGGRAFEEANTALDTFEKRAENSLRDTQTENAVARRAAIQSHGLNPDDEADVASWSAHNSSVLGSMQNPSQDQLKEGDYVGSMRVTKEDLRSARIQKEFSSRIVQDFSSMKSDFFEVVNPEEQIGGVLFTRAAEDYGMKTARKFSKWGSRFADDWKIATEADQVAFRQKQSNANGEEEVEMVWDSREKLADQFITGPVYSHIAETNSEYTAKRAAFLSEAFKKLRKDLKAGRTEGLETIEAIANTISLNSVGEDGVAKISPNEARVALLNAVEGDVKSYQQADSEFTESGLGGSNLPDAILSVKAANGALAKARGKMVAPTWFYDYGIHNDFERAMHIASGKRILLMKVYETMTAYRNAIKRNLDEAERQIELDAQKIGRNGEKVGLAKAEREYDKALAKKYRGQEVFATRKMLKKSYEALSTLTEDVKNHLAVSSGVDSDQFMARTGRAFLGTLATSFLSNVTSIVNNLTATVLDPYRTWSMSNRFWLKVWGPTKAVGRAIKFTVSDAIAMLPAKIRNSLTKQRKNSLIESVAAPIRAAIQERLMFERAGQMPTFDPISEIYQRLKANPLTFGRTTKANESQVERAIGRLMGKMPWAVAFGSWVKERIPGYFDGVINRVIAADARDFEQWLSPHLWEWARNLPGKSVAEKMEAARDSIITAEDFGVTDEGLSQIRDFMSSAGSLEGIAQRMLGENGDQSIKNSLPLTQSEREGVQFYAGRKYNVRASSTSPDFMKSTSGTKGVLKSSLHMFTSWVLQRMGSDANQFFKVKGGGLKKELAVAWNAMMLVLTTILVGAFGKTLKDGWRYLTGNPATTPNIFQAVDSPEMAMRYLAASTAGVLYFGGQIAGELMGGTGISSPLNNNLLDNNPAAGFIASAISTAQRTYQTGDLKYPLVDFARKNFWPAGVMLNYAMPGDVEARGATRAVRMGAVGMEVRPIGGGIGARETPTTPLVRDAVAALYEGNTAGYQKAREKFISYQIGQGKTQKEAEKRFDSSVSGRDPLRSVLGRTPTEDEEATIIRRLTPGQRSTVTKARSLFRKPKKIGLGRSKLGRRVRLGRKRPARRRVRLRRAGA